VAAADEVTAAQVDARVEVGGQLADGVVVQLDVGVQEVVYGAVVVLVLLPALAELFRAEVCVFVFLLATLQARARDIFPNEVT
jgi:hypothetical protein